MLCFFTDSACQDLTGFIQTPADSSTTTCYDMPIVLNSAIGRSFSITIAVGGDDDNYFNIIFWSEGNCSGTSLGYSYLSQSLTTCDAYWFEFAGLSGLSIGGTTDSDCNHFTP